MTHKNKYTQKIYVQGDVKSVFRVGEMNNFIVYWIIVHRTEKVLIIGNYFSLFLFT